MKLLPKTADNDKGRGVTPPDSKNEGESDDLQSLWPIELIQENLPRLPSKRIAVSGASRSAGGSRQRCPFDQLRRAIRHGAEIFLEPCLTLPMRLDVRSDRQSVARATGTVEACVAVAVNTVRPVG